MHVAYVGNPSSLLSFSHPTREVKSLRSCHRGATRSMSCYKASEPEMVDFHTFLCSVSGGAREPEAAKQIVTDVSKVLYFLDATGIDWTRLVDKTNVLRYLNKLQEMGVGAEGRITKINWTASAMVSSTLKNSSESRQQMDSWIPKTTCSQSASWRECPPP